MPTFSDSERAALLALKGVGPGVIARLESLGMSSLRDLATREPEEICAAASADTGSTCWRNSPQALAAVRAAVARARQGS